MATKKPGRGKSTSVKTINYATPALDKGLDIIELLSRQTEGLTKSQLARHLKRTVSEIFRMLLCLERRGYIAQANGERYVLTLKLFKLVQEHPPTERLICEAMPLMHQLSQNILQSCHIGVLEEERLVILAQVSAPTYLGFFMKLGSSVDIMDAASGYVILAHQSESQLQRTLEQWTLKTGKTLPTDLATHLAQIRKTGYEKRNSYVVKGVINISFPIFDDRGTPLCALTVPYIHFGEQTVQIAEAIKQTREVAARITTSIGGRYLGSRV